MSREICQTGLVGCPPTARPHARHVFNSSPGRPLSGLFVFWGRRANVQWMPRYFFILVYPDRAINDPRGTMLPSDEAAVGAARTIIDGPSRM